MTDNYLQFSFSLRHVKCPLALPSLLVLTTVFLKYLSTNVTWRTVSFAFYSIILIFFHITCTISCGICTLMFDKFKYYKKFLGHCLNYRLNKDYSNQSSFDQFYSLPGFLWIFNSHLRGKSYLLYKLVGVTIFIFF